MTKGHGSGRHLSPQGLAEYVAAGVPVVLPIAGQPPVSIFIDPGHQRIGLRTPYGGDSTPPPNPLESVHVSVVQSDAGRQMEVSATAPDLFPDAYAMLCAIADRIQLEENPPIEALEATLSVWGRLLLHRKRLSEDQEVGLFGELVILHALIGSAGEASAIGSWRGPLAEEHDFGFSDFDAEIKTTRGEARQHWINSLTQLVPTRSRPLWLVSVQITRAGSGHGEALPELVDGVLAALSDESASRCRKVLADLHWSDDQRDLYTNRWTLRSGPRAYAVDRSFPALTPTSINSLGIEAHEITQVRFELDVTYREASEPPEPLAPALQQLA